MYDDAVNEIVELVKLSANETDTRVEAKKILKRFLYKAAHLADNYKIVKIEEDIEDLLDIKIGGTD